MRALGGRCRVGTAMPKLAVEVVVAGRSRRRPTSAPDGPARPDRAPGAGAARTSCGRPRSRPERGPTSRANTGGRAGVRKTGHSRDGLPASASRGGSRHRLAGGRMNRPSGRFVEEMRALDAGAGSRRAPGQGLDWTKGPSRVGLRDQEQLLAIGNVLCYTTLTRRLIPRSVGICRTGRERCVVPGSHPDERRRQPQRPGDRRGGRDGLTVRAQVRSRRPPLARSRGGFSFA